MAVAYIALGSNIDAPLKNLNDALTSLSLLPRTKVSAVSGVYETKPVGYDNQPNFLNAVVKVETSMSPFTLLGALLGIESAMGRIRKIKNGPRIIDLDLLIYDDFKTETEDLILPHPRMLERSFVLAPLCDVNSDAFYKTKLLEIGTGGVLKTNYQLSLV